MEERQTVNPMTGEKLKSYSFLALEQAQENLKKLYENQKEWAKLSPENRAPILLEAAQRLRENSVFLAEQMTLEMGKPISQAKAEVEKCAVTFEYYASMGPQFLQTQAVKAQYWMSEVHLQPLGVIMAIMPWNFPLWQAVRFVAPAWMAGNTVLLKHAELTLGTAEAFAELMKDLWKKELLLHTPISHEVAAQLMESPKLQGVTFTGSTRGGKEVAANSGKNLKKTVLELGGSDAYIVLKDADIQQAAKICAEARLVNNGQSCVAAKRFIVEAPVKEKFVEAFIKELESARMGDPLDENTRLGPLASKKLQQNLIEQVNKLVLAGGEILCGGKASESKANFYPPTVIYFKQNHELINEEELFGPVAIVLEAKDEEQAIEWANSSIYGLGGAIFTKNIETGRRLAKRMECGFVVINDQVKSDPRLPFGGVKDSGFGRELSHFGLQEFCNIKTLGIQR